MLTVMNQKGMKVPCSSLCVWMVFCIIISCTSFHVKHVFTHGHKHLTRSRATSLSDDQPSVDEEILSPLGKLLLKRNDVMGYNADTFPPRDRPSDGVTTTKRQMAWPFQQFEASPLLDGTLACDCGFDPLGIAKSQKELFALREAEIKHARLAMLAAIGWPASELSHYTLAKILGLENLLAPNGRAPSVLNGGLNNELVLGGLGVFLFIGGWLEVDYQRRKADVPESLQNFYNMWREDGWDAPGNIGFDPLQLGKLLCQDNDAKKVVVQSVEIFNGRVAMLATVGYAMQEAITGVAVIQESPAFFYPLFVTVAIAWVERVW